MCMRCFGTYGTDVLKQSDEVPSRWTQFAVWLEPEATWGSTEVPTPGRRIFLVTRVHQRVRVQIRLRDGIGPGAILRSALRQYAARVIVSNADVASQKVDMPRISRLNSFFNSLTRATSERGRLTRPVRKVFPALLSVGP